MPRPVVKFQEKYYAKEIVSGKSEKYTFKIRLYQDSPFVVQLFIHSRDENKVFFVSNKNVHSDSIEKTFKIPNDVSFPINLTRTIECILVSREENLFPVKICLHAYQDIKQPAFQDFIRVQFKDEEREAQV